jgi:hypothetical protein
MRRLPAVTVLLGLLVLPADAPARLNPLKQAKGTVKPEVIIIFDTSGSMNEATSSSTDVGSDCNPNASIDLANDFMCTGSESSGADCAIASHSTAGAGMPPQCASASTGRMALAKRAVQNVLSELRGQASFGMVIYKDEPYFTYYPATPTTPVQVGIFLTRLELESGGSWTKGGGWGSGSCGTAPSPCPQSFTGPDAATAVSPALPTGYTLIPTGTTTPNSLYRRASGSSYAYTRMDWCGLSCTSGGYTWTYLGSYFTYPQSDGVSYASTPTYITSGGTTTTTSSLGTYWGPQIVVGTQTYVHYRFGSDDGPIGGVSAAKMFVPLHEDKGTSTDAQFEAKTAAILNRVNTAFNGGVVAASGGSTPNIAALTMASQIFKDRAAGSCTDSSIYPGGSCPYSSADPLKACRKRAVLLITDGDAADTPPSLPEMAKRIFCQGCANPSSCETNDPDFTAGTGNCDPATSNPINVFVLAIPTSTTDMKDAADWGDDGVLGNGGDAYEGTNETTITQGIKNALATAVSGDFVTGAAGISTSGLTNVTGDWALLPSVEVPGWKGHLRAYRLNKMDGDTTDPPILEWDAAEILNNMGAPLTRRILTGHPQYNTSGGLGYPVDLYLNGSIANFATVKAIANAAGSTTVGTATDAALESFFQWLYGATRSHRLGPILRCTPATIGPPSQYNLADNSVFATDNATRETLIYVTSNDGLIHAFRVGPAANNGGEEVFAFIPPNLLDRVYAVYLQGGQTNSVDSFKWILANSPRVEDVHVEPQIPDAAPTGATVSNRIWRTHLFVSMGPYVHGFVGLDITNPTDTSQPSPPYPLRSTKPFRVVALMDETSGGGESDWLGGTETMNASEYTYGEGWSVPAFYWIVNNQGEQEPHMSCGSGYGAATSGDKYKTIANGVGHYYYYYAEGYHIADDVLGSSAIPAFYNDPSAVALQVDAAVLADTAGVRDEFQEETLPVIAIYQANMLGQIRRFAKGTVQTPDTKNPVLIPAPSTADPSSPFYYSPAVLHLGSTKASGSEDNEVILAANSGAADEELTSAPEAKLYLRSETDGTVDGAKYRFTCKVSQLSSGTCTEGTLVNTGTLFSSCTGATCSTVGSTWPSNKAKPVGTPILVYNDPDGTGAFQVEAFYLLYEEASGISCAASEGKSWLIRISVDAATGTVNTVEEVTQVTGRASGMSLAGSGTRVVLSMSGTGTSTQATMGLGVQGEVLANPVTENPPMIEFWREIK